MKNQLNQFFFSSDIKILTEIYLRCINDMDAEIHTNGFIVCLNAIQALVDWNAYDKYKYNEIIDQLKAKKIQFEESKENENENTVEYDVAIKIINEILIK